MSTVELSNLDLALAAMLLVINGAISLAFGLRLEKRLAIAAVRMAVRRALSTRPRGSPVRRSLTSVAETMAGVPSTRSGRCAVHFTPAASKRPPSAAGSA